MTTTVSVDSTQRRWPLLLQQLVVMSALLAALAMASWISPVDVDGYIFWPVTGFAIAVLAHRPQLFAGVALALWLWGVIGPLGWVLGTLNLLTLAGPLIYHRVKRGLTLPASVPAKRLKSLGYLVLFSLLPSAFIGTMLLVLVAVEIESVLAVFLVYLLSDFVGTVFFMPLASYWLTREEPVTWHYPGIFALVIALPVALQHVGLTMYSQAALFLVLPGLVWMVQSASRSTLSHVLLLVFMAHLMMAFYGLGGYATLNEMAQMTTLALLLVTVLITVDTLQGMRVDRDQALRQAEWLSEHDHRSPSLNERGLMRWAEGRDLTTYAGVMFKPVNSHIFLRALTWEQLGALETRLIERVKRLFPAAEIAKLSDLTLVAVMPSAALNNMGLRDLMQVEIRVNETPFIIDGAVSAFQQLVARMSENLAQLNTLWSEAVSQPNLRLLHRQSAASMVVQQGLIGPFQRFRKAVETDGLELWLQPIQTLASGQITKAEVLARLSVQTPTGMKLISPGEFLPIFQTFNYLTDFDRHVLQQTFAQFRRMQASLGTSGTLNVNISGSTLSDRELVAWLFQHLTEQQVDPALVCIEITETDRVQDRDTAAANIVGMRNLGFQVAIDDFGTGLASFEYLNHFPVNVLKLDGQFISDIADNPRHQAIVRAMVAVAESYNLELVGEFVDNERALLCLQELGVHYAQGYYIGKPSNDWR